MSDTKAGSERFAQWFAKSGFNTRSCAEDSWNASRRKTAREITQKLRSRSKAIRETGYGVSAVNELDDAVRDIEREFGLAGKDGEMNDR